MSLVDFVKTYLIALPIFFAIDMIWLLVVAKNFYREQLGDLFTKQVVWPAAISFYLLFIAGVVFFAIYPAVERNSLITALVYGALFGFFTYATYDLTNLATIRNWPLTMTLVDLVWGTFLASSVAAGTYLVVKYFNLV